MAIYNQTRQLKETFYHIMTLAVPTMAEQLMQTAVQYIDTAMVGALGTSATAAVGSTVTVNWLVNSTISALSVGFLSHIARALGSQDEKKARAVTAQAVFVCLITGVIFTIITLFLSPFIPALLCVDESVRDISALYFFILYLPMLPRTAIIIFGTVLRASGDSKTPMRAGFLVNGVNVVLNFFLIFPCRNISIGGRLLPIWGADWGVTGAAIASAASFLAGGAYITYCLFFKSKVSPRKMGFFPNKSLLYPCLKIAFPNMIQRFFTSLGYVIFASMVNSLGQVSTAAHTIANTVESAFYIPAYGMQTAAATLSGNAWGAGNAVKMKEYTSVLLKIEIALMTASGAILFLFAPWLVSLISKDSSVSHLAVTVLRMVALSEPIYGVAIIIEGILQGVGETLAPLKVNIIGMWGVRNLGTFICINFFSMGLVSAWSCMIAHNLLLFVFFTLYYKKGSWNPLK